MSQIPQNNSTELPVLRRQHKRIVSVFQVTIRFGDLQITGMTTEASAFGATIRFSQNDYELLKSHPEDMVKNKTTVSAVTTLNELFGQFNSLYEHGGEYFGGFKLLNGKSWI